MTIDTPLWNTSFVLDPLCTTDLRLWSGGVAVGSPLKVHHSERWPALDGMRAAAVLAVFCYHLDFGAFGIQVFGGGYCGVDVFFVLSGFLITTLLIKEVDLRGRLDFSAFYARRALRLFPALALVIIFAVIAAATIAPVATRHPTFSGLPWVLLYVGNWDRALVSGSALGLLGHTWSLAVEEQFYLLWPVIFLLFIAGSRNRRLIGAGLIGLAGIDVLYQLTMTYRGWFSSRIYFGLDTHCQGLLIGCGIAFLLAARCADAEPGRWTSAFGVVGACTLVVTVFAAVLNLNPKYNYTQVVGITSASAATGAMLWSILTSPVRLIDLVLRSKPAVWIGKRSYGIYLWHYPILAALNPFPMIGMRRHEVDLVVIVLTFAMAAFSYRYVEQPFLRLKSRFEYARLSEPAQEVEPRLTKWQRPIEE